MVKKNRIKLLLILCLILNISSYSIMAQDIVINNTVINHTVLGNGTLPDGDVPLTLAPSNNSVTIQGLAGVSAGVVAGAGDRAGLVEDVVSNRLVINIAGVGIGQGVIRDEVYGGWAFGPGNNAINNRLSITNGTINGLNGAYGGMSNAGRAEGNVFEMEGGVIAQNAYGGRGQTEAINNRLSITNGNINGADGAYGGMSNAGRAEGNVFEMEGGTIAQSAYGGWGQTEATNNRLSITNGTINGEACGGYSDTGRAGGNELEMAGGTITGDACGGQGEAEAINNKLSITNGTINGEAYGGYSHRRRGEGNELEMAGGTITGDACGGQGEAEAINNSLTIRDGNINGRAYGGYSVLGDAVNNSLSITNGTINGVAYGGRGQIEAINNRLVMTNGNIGGNVTSGRSMNGEAKANTLEIAGGVIRGDVTSGHSQESNANENKVIISGGEILGNIYGGRSRDAGAVGNTIEISGDPKFSTNTYIYGGYSDTAGKDTFTDNVFNIKKDNIEIGGIGGFQILNFYNPVKNGNAMLICTNGRVDINNVEVNAEMNVDEDVDVNDKYILIRAIRGFDGIINKEVKVKQGVLSRYDAFMFIDNLTDLGIVITREYINPRAQIITQSKAATLEIISEGLDLIVEEGVGSAKEASKVAEGLVPFVAVKGSKSKISTGAEINIEGIEVMGGVGKEFNKEGKKITVGGFVEYGRKTSKMSEKIDVDKISADLTGDYKGVGVLIRADIFSNSYIEGSARVGGYRVDFNTDNIDQEKEERVTYDYNSMYLGGHAGVGYIYKLNDRVNIDMSSKFLFMHQQGKEVKLSSGDNIKFSNLETGKVRVGANIDYKLQEQWRPYIGINYDYEVIGKKVEAVTIDIELPEVDLRRGRFTGQIGISKELGNFDIDCSVMKYIGSKDGIDAMIRARYCFGKENIALARLMRKALKRSKYFSRVSDKSLTKIKSK